MCVKFTAKMKLFVNLLVVCAIIAQLVFCVDAAPYPQPQEGQQMLTMPATITADAMNNGIAISQSFMQLLSLFLNNFNSMIPKMVDLFTSTSPAAGKVPIPSAPGIPSLPSLQTPDLMAVQPEKMNSEAVDTAIIPQDVEVLDNEIINSANNKIPI